MRRDFVVPNSIFSMPFGLALRHFVRRSTSVNRQGKLRQRGKQWPSANISTNEYCILAMVLVGVAPADNAVTLLLSYSL